MPNITFMLGCGQAGSRIRSVRGSYTKNKLKAKLWLNHVGDREDFDGNELKTLDSYTLVNISASWRFFQKKNTALDLEIPGTNIFDESYEEKSGYPMADACVMAGIRLTF